MTSSIPKTRFFGFDLLRILSMVAIVTFHVNEAVFWQDQNPIYDFLWIYRLFSVISQHLTFSGFTIIALSFFLIGKSRFKNFLPLAGFLLLGIAVLASFQEDPPFTGFYWEWDIYSFLFVSLLFLQGLVLMPRGHFVVAALAFLATWLPVWRWIPNSADIWSQALVGVCPPEGVGSWPLLPWVAWPILFFCLGRSYAQNSSWRTWLATFGRREQGVWLGLLLLSLPLFGGFNWVPIGPHFYCHTLRLDPPVFWSTMIWVIFGMRLSMVKAINDSLGRLSWVRWISNLRWNQRFGWAYLVHLPLLGIGMLLRGVFFQHPVLFDVFFVCILPVAELLVRVLEKLFPKRMAKPETA